MTEKTMVDLVDRYGIAGEIVSGPDQTTDENGWEHNAFTVRLAYRTPAGEAASLETPWRMGVGLNVGEWTGTSEILPDRSVADVLVSLTNDMQYRTYSFEEFAHELGYNEDSRKAHATWTAVRKAGRQFYDWCYSEAMVDELIETAQNY